MDIVKNECPTEILVDIKEDKTFLSYMNGKDAQRSLNTVDSNTKIKCSNCEKSASSSKNLKEKIDRNSNYAICCKARGSHESSNSDEVKSQLSVQRLRWKTPSPQSMSRISKEAFKVVDHLNSSSIFDEGLLITEEVLPIPLNFDELDDDTDQGNTDDNVFEDVILNHESTVSVKSLRKIEKVDENLNYQSCSNDTSEKNLGNLKQALVERNLAKMDFRVSRKNDSTSKESYSSGIHSSSLGNSDSLACCDGVDVFNLTHIASEDEENMQLKTNKLVLTKENKIGCKTATKNLSMNKQKLRQCGTLRNLSNVKEEISSKRLFLGKNVTTPLKRMNISKNKKENVPITVKPIMKKPTLSVGSSYSLKSISRSNSFHFQNTKELISSIQKPHPTIKIDSGCSSSSSDVKQQNLFATPSRRYSICPSLKSASAIKPPLTSVTTSSHNFVFPRYTPQPARPSRLSFSRSWQQSDISQFSAEKTFKQPFFTAMPSSTSKVASVIKNSSKPGKLPFSQSMSAVQSSGKNIITTANKARFSNKLNLSSPLAVEQNKKLARALFPSVSEQQKIK